METQKSLQNKLFHDTPEDALTTDVLAAGGYKKVGHHLRPDLTPEQASAWLRACLNVERNEKLSPGQVLDIKRVAKEHDSFATITYDAQQLGYAVEWIQPADELATLVTNVSDDIERIEARQRRIEQILQSMHDTKNVVGLRR